MEKPISINTENTLGSSNSKKFVINKTEIVVFCLVFIGFFFQMFPQMHGRFIIVYYLSTLIFLAYVTLQTLGFEKFHYNKPILFAYFLFLCWLFYGLIRTYFNSDHEVAGTFLHLRMMYFFIFYVVTQYLQKENRLRIFENIVVICVIWNILVCFWEMSTLTHLPGSRHYGRLIPTPTGSFYNENDLASAFLICCAALFYLKGNFYRHFGITLVIIVFIITCVQGARLNLMALFPILLLHFFFKTKLSYKLITILSLTLIFTFLLMKFPLIKLYVDYLIEDQILSFGTEMESDRLGSMRQRVSLYIACLEMFVETYGFGVGVGQFERSVSLEQLISTGSIDIPHNFFLEILATEGIVAIILLLAIVFSPLLPILKSKNRSSILSLLNLKTLSENEKRVLTFLFFFIVAAAVPSSIRFQFPYWSLLGFHYALIYSKNECNT